MTDLAVNQNWHPADGSRPRQIIEIRAATLRDRGYYPGEILVLWAIDVTHGGVCLQRSFRAWIKKTKAKLQ